MKQFFLSLIEVGSYWFHATRLRLGFFSGGNIPVDKPPEVDMVYRFRKPKKAMALEDIGPPPSPTGFPSTEKLMGIVRHFSELARAEGPGGPSGPTQSSWILIDGNGCLGAALRFREKPDFSDHTVHGVEKMNGMPTFQNEPVRCCHCGRHMDGVDFIEEWLMKELR